MTNTMVAKAGESPARALKIGLLGSGIAGTRTPRMHVAAAKSAGLSYEYHLVDSQVRKLPKEPAEILALLETEGFDGLNVTYPYKRAVLPLMDELSQAARNVGAVNTVVLRDGRRSGHNTDHWGFSESLRQGLPGAPRDRVLLLGAGGAGGAVAHALLDAGVTRLAVRDVNDQVAVELVALLDEHYGPHRAEVVTDVDKAADQVQGIVNASPVGMEKMPGMPLPEEAIRPDHWVSDIVYFPLETELLATARAKGCAVLPGSGMALYQAVRAFKLFTGCEPDVDRMREAFESFT